MSETCVVIHNIIVRMVGNSVEEEKDEEAGIKTDMYEEEDVYRDSGGPVTEFSGKHEVQWSHRRPYLTKKCFVPFQN